MTKVVKKKARRLRRTLRRTLGTLFLISALVIAAIPVDYLQATGADGTDVVAPPDAGSTPVDENWGTLAEKYPEMANAIPTVKETDVIYTTGDNKFQFAYVSDGKDVSAVILGYSGGALSGGTLAIPDEIKYVYLQMTANDGTGRGYVAVGKSGNFLYYRIPIMQDVIDPDTKLPVKDENGNVVQEPSGKYEYFPCSYEKESVWSELDEDLYYYPDNKIPEPDASGNVSDPIAASDPNFQRIKNLQVQYIGNQYLKTGSKVVTNPDGTTSTVDVQGTWQVAGTVDYANKDKGVFAQNGTNITTLEVGSSMRGIGDYAFYGCTNLEGITLNDGLQVIGIGAFAECIRMSQANIRLNSAITVIGDNAFYNCMALTDFTVPAAVRKLGKSVFEGCSALKNIDLTGKDAPVALESVGENAFRNCSSLESLTFPTMTTFEQEIPITMFEGCSSLKYIEAANLGVNFTGTPDEFKHFKNNVVPSTFYFKGIKDSPLHQTATANDIAYSFFDDTLGEYVYELKVPEIPGQTDGKKAVCWVNDSGKLVKCEMESGMHTVTIPVIIGPNDVKIIAERTFQDNCALEKVTIPGAITGIEQNAFRGCHKLEDVIFENPPEDMVIGGGAFKTQNVGVYQADCDNKMHTDPNERPENKTPHLNFVGPISNSAVPFVYAMTPGENINAGEQDLTYITYQSGWPTNLEVRYNPNTDKNELVDYPTLKKMEEGKYAPKGGTGNTGYAYITQEYATAAVSAAEKYRAGNQGDLTEDESNILAAALNMVLPDGIEAIGTHVTPQADGSVIEEGLFEYKEREEEWADNANLRKTITAEGIEEVQPNAFKGCKYLEGITFSDKTTAIGDHAFENCVVLKNVSIPATVSSLGLSPFRGCEVLSEVNFNESPYFSCENSVIFELGEEGVHVALVEYLNGKVPHIVDAKDVEGITSIYPEAFMNSNIESADLSTTKLEEIPESAFQGTDRLFSVTLPNGCRRINKNAFADSNIRQLVVPATVNVISDQAFAHIDTENPEYTALTFYGQKGSVAEDYALTYNINFSEKPPEYEVRLFDEEGNLVRSIYVEQGQPLVIPDDLEDLPPVKGYTRLTWTPSEGTIITEITNVYAKYVPMEPSEYQKTVNFIAFDKETVISTQTVTPGESAVPPIAPEEEGYEFTGWWPEEMEITDETENPYNIYAQYEKIDSAANTHTVTFLDYDQTFLYTQSVEHGKDATAPRTPSREGYTFKEWLPYPVNVTEDMTVVAQYTADNSGNPGTSGSPTPPPGGSGSPSPSPSASPSTSPSPGGPGGDGNGGNTGSGNDVKMYTLTVRNGSGSGTYAAGSQIIVVADEPGRNMVFDNWTVSPAATSVTDKTLSAMAITMPANDVAVIANYKSRTTGTGNTSSSNTVRPGGTTGTVNNGGTQVIIDKNGLSNTGVVSATVNGSSDNFVIKVTEDSAATEAVLKALQAEYGSLDNIKYFPMDISLYDSTGKTKITDTTGLSVSITLPLPDSLIPYAGNNKVAGVVNDKLDKLTPKFTTISGVSCITFTAEHFSPYVIYVDITNLSDGTISDSTPTTGDGIHPKWFLSIGLACLSFVMFAMKDSGKASRKKQKVRVRA